MRHPDCYPPDLASTSGRETCRVRLVDRGGEWCAWCLAYFEPSASAEETREANHMLPKKWFVTRFPGAGRTYRHFPLEWTVRAHRRCHRGPRRLRVFQESSDGLRDALNRYDPSDKFEGGSDWSGGWTRSRGSFDLRELDEGARRAHEAGVYPVSAVLKWMLREAKLSSGYPERELDDVFHLEVSSLAGVRHRWQLHLDPATLRRGGPRLAYTYTNYLSDRGDMVGARALMALADGLYDDASTRARADFRPDRTLRHAQVDRTWHASAEAIAATQGGDVYRSNTALVIASTVALQSRDTLRRAHDRAEELLSRPGLSWLYQAEAWFVLGCLELMKPHGWREVGEAYQCLVRAQYIYVMLGLQGTPHGGLGTDLIPDGRDDALPSDVLLTSRLMPDLPRSRCLDLRAEAILDGRPHSLQDRLLASLAEWQSTALLIGDRQVGR